MQLLRLCRSDPYKTWQECDLHQLPIGKEDEFKGIIDLFEMKAYIYNDDKGDDISVQTSGRYGR